MSAVKLVSTGKNEVWTRWTSACEKEQFDVEK